MRRLVGALFAVACLGGIAYELRAAVDFPTESPVTVVDEALVAHLRQNPGLHLALAEDAVITAALELRDDPDNRSFYGTRVDMREARGERAIHIQRKGDRGAIHTDAYNPRAGFWFAFLHGFEVPLIPLGAGALLGIVVGLWPKRTGAKRSEPIL